MGTGIIGGIAAFLIGTGLATATVIGVVSSQTADPSSSQVDVNSPDIEYGSN